MVRGIDLLLFLLLLTFAYFVELLLREVALFEHAVKVVRLGAFAGEV